MWAQGLRLWCRSRGADPAYLAVTDADGGRQPGAAGHPLGGQVARMDMGYDGPSGLVQQGHEAARGFGCIAAALRGPDHHLSDLGRTGGETARGSVACTVPAAAPVARTRTTQFPHSDHLRVSGGPPGARSGQPGPPRTTAPRR
jgi:hypothetical protein